MNVVYIRSGAEAFGDRSNRITKIRCITGENRREAHLNIGIRNWDLSFTNSEHI